MTAWATGAWIAGAWQGTAWAQTFTPPAPSSRPPPGGGRIIGYLPPYIKPRKQVTLQLPVRDKKKDDELARLVKRDAEQRAIELAQANELANLALAALDEANKVHISVAMTQEQVARFKKRLEDEDILLLLM